MRASFEIKHQLCGCREEVLREEEGGESKITVSDEEKRDQFFLQSALQIGSEKKILLSDLWALDITTTKIRREWASLNCVGHPRNCPLFLQFSWAQLPHFSVWGEKREKE